jgi:CMP-N,N'-diacetyllegionaminic acid synthase
MNSDAQHLAIIPARSGSKRFPRKNIAPLDGIPLLAWSIKTALAAKRFDVVLLSTDSEEYAEVGKDYGAAVPRLRNANLSGDTTSSAAVIINALSYYEAEGMRFETVTLLQPTSPLRSVADIHNAFVLIELAETQSVVGVTPCDHPPQWCNVLPDNHSLEQFIPAEYRVPRQELLLHYRINGALYLAHTDSFIKHRDFLMPGSRALIMPPDRSVDIDTNFDLLVAESIINQKNYKKPWTI